MIEKYINPQKTPPKTQLKTPSETPPANNPITNLLERLAPKPKSQLKRTMSGIVLDSMLEKVKELGGDEYCYLDDDESYNIEEYES